MTSRRIERVNSLLREVISETITQDLKNIPIPELITVTAVETTSDLRHAKVFISLIQADTKMKEETIAMLTAAAGAIGAISSKKVVMRYFPQLTFKIDESIENFMQIDKLLKQIEKDKNQQGD